MMREEQIHTATMNIEMISQILCAHCGTLNVPTGETVAPGRAPPHDMLRRCFFPKRKIGRITFFVLPIQRTRIGNHLFQHSAGKFTISKIGIIFRHIKINRTV
jgi:hypothetical protein